MQKSRENEKEYLGGVLTPTSEIPPRDNFRETRLGNDGDQESQRSRLRNEELQDHDSVSSNSRRSQLQNDAYGKWPQAGPKWPKKKPSKWKHGPQNGILATFSISVAISRSFRVWGHFHFLSHFPKIFASGRFRIL